MEYYFVEFSPRQGCFHISTISEIIGGNRIAMSDGFVPQYFPIACADIYEKAAKIIQAYHRTMGPEQAVYPWLPLQVVRG